VFFFLWIQFSIWNTRRRIYWIFFDVVRCI
jgi:hypothetical protein